MLYVYAGQEKTKTEGKIKLLLVRSLLPHALCLYHTTCAACHPHCNLLSYIFYTSQNSDRLATLHKMRPSHTVAPASKFQASKNSACIDYDAPKASPVSVACRCYFYCMTLLLQHSLANLLAVCCLRFRQFHKYRPQLQRVHTRALQFMARHDTSYYSNTATLMACPYQCRCCYRWRLC